MHNPSKAMSEGKLYPFQKADYKSMSLKNVNCAELEYLINYIFCSVILNLQEKLSNYSSDVSV